MSRVDEAGRSSGFVARSAELARLFEILNDVRLGHGRICFVQGEPGAGKSALLTEFMRAAHDRVDELLVARAVCNAYAGSGDPYLPFREILCLLAGAVEAPLTRGRISVENAGRLRRSAASVGEALVDSGPDLIGMFVPGGALLARLAARFAPRTPLIERLESLVARGPGDGASLGSDRVCEQYARVLHKAAARQPIVLMVDDLHWADPASIALLFHLARNIEAHAILLLGAYRPRDVAMGRGGQRHPLEPVLNELRRYHGDASVDLDGVSESERRQLVDGLVDSEANLLPERFRQELLARTHGHPLFAVEMLDHLKRSGALVRDAAGRWSEQGQVRWDRLPPRADALVAEQVGRLDADLRATLDVASVEGEEFTAEVVARARELPDREIIRQLAVELEHRHGLIVGAGMRRLDGQRISSYRFRHGLFQSYVYGQLDGARRSYLHEDVGRALEMIHATSLDEVAVPLAHHFAEAGNFERAVDYLLRAGEQSLRYSAHDSAIAHLEKGLRLASTLRPSMERHRKELALHIPLGIALIAAKGWSSPAVEAVYRRALTLADQVADRVHTFAVLRGLWEVDELRGNLDAARALAQRLVDLAEIADDHGHRVVAHAALGETLLFTAEYVSARAHLERAVAAHYPARDQVLAFTYGGYDPGIGARSELAHALWCLGDTEAALAGSRAALESARNPGHPGTLVFTLVHAAVLRVLMRDWQDAYGLAVEALELAREHRLPFWIHYARVLRGRCRVEREEPDLAIQEIREGIAEYRDMGSRLEITLFLGLLSEACLRAGRTEEALAAAESGLAICASTGLAFNLPELHRLRGEALLSAPSPDLDAAAQSIATALSAARSRNAVGWERLAIASEQRLRQYRSPDDAGPRTGPTASCDTGPCAAS